MKLEVGKTYIDGNGAYSTIVRREPGYFRDKYIDQLGVYYSENGSWGSIKPCRNDLIAEAPASVALSCIMVKQMETEYNATEGARA